MPGSFAMENWTEKDSDHSVQPPQGNTSSSILFEMSTVSANIKSGYSQSSLFKLEMRFSKSMLTPYIMLYLSRVHFHPSKIIHKFRRLQNQSALIRCKILKLIQTLHITGSKKSFFFILIIASVEAITEKDYYLEFFFFCFFYNEKAILD